MALPRNFSLPGRRRFLTRAFGFVAAVTGGVRLFAAEFWNAKDPSVWTDEEKLALTSKSPWARLATIEVKGADDPTESVGGGPQIGGRAGAPARRPASVPIVVRWESAQPVLDALHTPLGPEFAGHYVLSVTNLPGVPRPGRAGDAAPDDDIERLQNGAVLQAKGKNPVEAGVARRMRGGTILFGFSRDYLPLTLTDRDILFRLDTEKLTLKAKFDGKDMSYHGKLAV
jgi:hypothetical protein